MLKALAVVATAIIVSGCAGVNFERPADADFKVGKATYSDVSEKLGKPQSTGESLVNDRKIKRVAYAYAASGGQPAEEGVIPARAQVYFFEKDVLIGTEFTSSFKEDSSNFDDSKVEYIKKGETTRSQVLLTFGRPSIVYVEPLVKKTHGEAIGYLYQTTRGNVYTGLKFKRKTLLITFDEAEKVLEVDYSLSDMK